MEIMPCAKVFIFLSIPNLFVLFAIRTFKGFRHTLEILAFFKGSVALKHNLFSAVLNISGFADLGGEDMGGGEEMVPCKQRVHT